MSCGCVARLRRCHAMLTLALQEFNGKAFMGDR
jgi:hypothetical protein